MYVSLIVSLMSDFFICPLVPLRDFSVAIIIRRGEGLWEILGMLNQLTFSMRSGIFFIPWQLQLCDIN